MLNIGISYYTNMLADDLERFNEWWFTGKVRRELALPFRRYAFSRMMESVGKRQILIVTGARRVGKTTLLHQTIKSLLETVDRGRILYFSFEESEVGPEEVLEFYEKKVLKRAFEETDRVFVFFDEIQYAANWSSVLKRFYDLYPNLKFFVSGSSSLLLSKDAVERLASRFFFLKLKPLTFSEFLELKGVKRDSVESSRRRVETLFYDYLRKSGFPEIVDWESEVRIAEYVRNSVVDRVALRDIPRMFKTRDMALLEKIINLILSEPGSIINVNSLSRTWGESKITISNYLKFLESSLLIRSLSNFRPSFLSSSRKLKKYYPATPSLIFSYSKEGFEKKMAAVLETYAVNALEADCYFREGKKEVDIILRNKELLPIEVKESVDERDVDRFSKLVEYIGAKKGVILSLGREMKRMKVEVIPVYMIEFLLDRAKPQA